MSNPTQPTAEQIAEALREAKEAQRGYERYATDPKHIKVLADYCAELVEFLKYEQARNGAMNMPNSELDELLVKWSGRA